MSQCDMCRGTGKMEIMEYSDGSPMYYTTSAETNVSIDKEAKKIGTRVKEINCGTCGGSGILPHYLEPAYWQGRSDEVDVQIDRSLFGLGKYIRKVFDV